MDTVVNSRSQYPVKQLTKSSTVPQIERDTSISFSCGTRYLDSYDNIHKHVPITPTVIGYREREGRGGTVLCNGGKMKVGLLNSSYNNYNDEYHNYGRTGAVWCVRDNIHDESHTQSQLSSVHNDQQENRQQNICKKDRIPNNISNISTAVMDSLTSVSEVASSNFTTDVINKALKPITRARRQKVCPLCQEEYAIYLKLNDHLLSCPMHTTSCPYCYSGVQCANLSDHMLLCKAYGRACFICERMVMVGRYVEHCIQCSSSRVDNNINRHNVRENNDGRQSNDNVVNNTENITFGNRLSKGEGITKGSSMRLKVRDIPVNNNNTRTVDHEDILLAEEEADQLIIQQHHNSGFNSDTNCNKQMNPTIFQEAWGIDTTSNKTSSSRGTHTTMYHGTTPTAAKDIITNRQLLPSTTGLLGAGVYVTADIAKARRYGPCIIQCIVFPGRTCVIRKKYHLLQKCWRHKGYDSAWVPAGSYVLRGSTTANESGSDVQVMYTRGSGGGELEEHCIWDNRRVFPIAVVEGQMT